MYTAVRELIEPKWSLEILVSLSEESPQNFSAIERQFDTSSDVVSGRLQLLVEYELVSRTEHTARDVRYSIKPHGERFLARLAELEEFLNTSAGE